MTLTIDSSALPTFVPTPIFADLAVRTVYLDLVGAPFLKLADSVSAVNLVTGDVSIVSPTMVVQPVNAVLVLSPEA